MRQCAKSLGISAAELTLLTQEGGHLPGDEEEEDFSVGHRKGMKDLVVGKEKKAPKVTRMKRKARKKEELMSVHTHSTNTRATHAHTRTAAQVLTPLLIIRPHMHIHMNTRTLYLLLYWYAMTCFFHSLTTLSLFIGLWRKKNCVCVSVCLSVCLSDCLSVCLSVCLCVCHVVLPMGYRLPIWLQVSSLSRETGRGGTFNSSPL